MDDSLVDGYITAATWNCEDRTKRAFMPQTWKLTLSQWPGRTPGLGYEASNKAEDYWKWNHFEVPKPPLVSVVSFVYYDSNYNPYYMTQTGPPPLPAPDAIAGNYILCTDPQPGEIQLPFAGIWPTTVLIPGSAIELTYNCGYSQFAGNMDVDQNGVCTPNDSPQNVFDPSIVGTWITLTDPTTSLGGQSTGSYTVASWISPTQIQLRVQNPNPLAFPSSPEGYNWTANNVPMPIRQAIMFLMAHMYENREPIVTGRSETAIEVPGTIDAMLGPWTITRS